MENLQGLHKRSEQADGQEMLSFLLDQQDPVTGAFIDHSYPAFSFFAPSIIVGEMSTYFPRLGSFGPDLVFLS